MASSIPATITILPSAITSSLTSLPTHAMAALPPRFQTLITSLWDKLPEQWTSYIIPGVLGYLLLVRSLRYRREESMRRKFGFLDRESLKRMTVEDAQLIIKFQARLEFPLMAETSLQFGLFKVCLPRTVNEH
jgi:hypothetical protein